MFNTCQYGKDRTRDNTGTAMVVIASGNNFGSSKSCQDESWNEGNSAAVFFWPSCCGLDNIDWNDDKANYVHSMIR